MRLELIVSLGIDSDAWFVLIESPVPVIANASVVGMAMALFMTRLPVVDRTGVPDVLVKAPVAVIRIPLLPMFPTVAVVDNAAVPSTRKYNATLDVLSRVITCPELMTAVSEDVGILPQDHVAGAFQLAGVMIEAQ